MDHPEEKMLTSSMSQGLQLLRHVLNIGVQCLVIRFERSNESLEKSNWKSTTGEVECWSELDMWRKFDLTGEATWKVDLCGEVEQAWEGELVEPNLGMSTWTRGVELALRSRLAWRGRLAREVEEYSNSVRSGRVSQRGQMREESNYPREVDLTLRTRIGLLGRLQPSAGRVLENWMCFKVDTEL